jgi:plasmid replication initiation protein
MPDNIDKKPRLVKSKGVKLVKKSNNLIEARYKFDIWETRIFTSILTQIERIDEDFKVYRLYLRDIIKEFDINNGNAYELLRQAADSLMNKKFYLDYEGDGAERKKVYHIIRNVDYMTKLIDENKRSLNEYVDVSIDPDMKPLLLQLKEQFTTYDMRNIIRFKSSYSVRIYELLKQYESIGHRTIDVDYLKSAFEINDEYPLFGNFYQKIIEPAHAAINEHTDLFVTEIEKVKSGKKVIALKFIFHRKSEHSFNKSKKATTKSLALPFEDNFLQVADDSIDELFVKYQSRVVGDFGVAPTVFMTTLKGKTNQQVEKAIRITDEAKRKGDLGNVAGFFIEALRNDFTNEKEEKKQKEKDLKQKEIALKKAKATELEAKAKAINDTVRKLTAADPSLTARAIERVKQSATGQSRLRVLELSDPSVEDFRQDEVLRELVKMAILEIGVL